MRSLLVVLACACQSPGEPPLDPDPVDLSADPDGDGLTTGEELEGYWILVDETGLWDPVNGRIDDPRTERLIRSNPDVADSDGDGLDDGDERAWATDATRADTDGDGLDDPSELFRWGTSATSVDTDGDATGGRAEGSNTPLPRLFDGAELDLVERDGAWWAGVHATSPLLADTDGDGASDYYEVLSPQRDPIIPERPEFTIGLTPGTTVAMDLDVEWGESYENTSSYQTTQAGSQSRGQAVNAQLSGEIYGELEAWVGIRTSSEATVGLSTNPFGFSTKVSAYAGLDYTVGASGSWSYASSQSGRGESRQALYRANQDARTRQQRITGGRIGASFDVVNTGDLAFKLTDLAIGAKTFDSRARVERPLTTLHAAIPDVTLTRGERATLFFEDDDVPADRIIAALGDPTSLSFTPVAYGLERSEGVDLDYADEDILQRTARVEVVWGDGRSVVHHRASDVGRDLDGEPIGPTVRELLQEAGVDAVSRESESGVIVYEIDGEPTVDWPDEGDPWPEADFDPGERWLKVGWLVVLERGVRAADPPLDLLDTPLNAGERALVVRVTDLDRDGLSSWQESQLGTSDESIDSDGDGVSDPKELVPRVVVAYDIDGDPILSASDPGAIDSDGDGLHDTFESAYENIFSGLRLDPLNPDTDGDGYTDGFERANDLKYDPLVYTFYSPPKVECRETTVRWIDPGGVERFCRGVDAVVTDTQRDLVAIRAEYYRTDGSYAREEVEVGLTGRTQWSDHWNTTIAWDFSPAQVCARTRWVHIVGIDWEGEYTGTTCYFGGDL